MIHIEHNKPLAPLTTLGVGGTARLFVRAETEAEVVEAVEHAQENGLGLFVLGGGSNVLVSDAGFDGLVLQIAIRSPGFRVSGSEFDESKLESWHRQPRTGNQELETRNSKLITVGAGEDWDEFVDHCVHGNLAGVECLSGIPGSVGGTPVQNVGAYGQEVSETIVSVRCLDRQSREVVTLDNADCGFSYRRSIFNTSERDRYIVLNVRFRLRPDGAAKIAYPELEREMAGRETSLKAVREAVLGLRRSKSMVIEKDDPNSRSAGSFFKNPVVSYDKLAGIRDSYENVPYFEFDDQVKIPAAWLIDKSGFSKGFVHGNAGISANHTLAIINRGHATAAEILELKEMIQTHVAKKFAIDLQPEPVFVGF